MLSGGHADNALPQTAAATVNCRVLPGETQSEVEERLRAAAGSGIEMRVKFPMQPNPASPVSEALLNHVQGLVQSMWPGLPAVPVMETGGTDAKPLRAAGIPTYGISQMFYDLDDVRAHGKDERIRTGYFYDGLEFGYRLMQAMAGGF
jgi:acetylornithine deacetylase/succinyl-diaminopimelate desuccinylase-like protein